MAGAVGQRVHRGQVEQRPAVGAPRSPCEQPAAHVRVHGLALYAEPSRHLHGRQELTHVDEINIEASPRAIDHHHDSTSTHTEAPLPHRTLAAGDAFWRPSNQMGVLNTDLAKQLQARTLGARLWRLTPGQASTRHRHRDTHELYVLLEGTGRIRVEQDLHTLAPLSALLVEPEHVRQLFNDTDADQLWLVVGAPPEPANTLEMTDETLAWIYPDGPKALPPELSASPSGVRA